MQPYKDLFKVSVKLWLLQLQSDVSLKVQLILSGKLHYMLILYKSSGLHDVDKMRAMGKSSKKHLSCSSWRKALCRGSHKQWMV